MDKPYKTIPRLGIQLYTLRDDCAKNFVATLEAVAAMGYEGVEFAGVYGGLDPKELAALLRRLKLACAGLHTSCEEIENPASSTYAYAKAIQASYLTCGYCDGLADDFPNALRRSIAAAKVAQQQQRVFTYHNHNHEFRKLNGEYALDLFYRSTDRALVQAEIDVYWVKKGGADPVPYLLKHAGRVPQIHLKDMDGDDGSMTEVGNGIMDLPGIFNAASDMGTDWIIVEQDTCKRPPLESARISINNLKQLGLFKG